MSELYQAPNVTEDLSGRVFGSELEYSIELLYPEKTDWHKRHTLSEAILGRAALAGLPSGVSRIGSFLSNGARMYVDSGHPEYATPECIDLDDFVAHELAGEEIITDVLTMHIMRGALRGFKLYRRLIDIQGTTWGYHLNHQIEAKYVTSPSRGRLLEEKLALFGIHNATHGIYTGAGLVRRGRFYLTQKSQDVWTDYNICTTSSKPVVNMRHEPLIMGDNYARIHNTSGDAHQSPLAIKLHAGTQSLLVKLIEQGRTIDSIGLRLDPRLPLYIMMRQVAEDVRLNRTYPLANGRKARALDIQRALCEEFKTLDDLSPDNRHVISLYEQTLDNLEFNQDALNEDIDWIAKRNIIKIMLTKANIECAETRDNIPYYDTPRSMDKALGEDGNYDLSRWVEKVDGKDELRVVKGYGIKLRERNRSGHLPAGHRLATAKNTPPYNTRAFVRGEYLNSPRAKGKKWDRIDIDWHYAYEQHSTGHLRISLGEPQIADPKALEEVRKAPTDNLLVDQSQHAPEQLYHDFEL